MAESSRTGSRLGHKNAALEDLELELLLEGLFHYYGYDFRNYDRMTVKGRVLECVIESRTPSISRFQERILRDRGLLERLIRSFSPPQTAILGDRKFVQALKQKVLPILRTYPTIRIWYVGCSSGQEVYSLAILLQEEGIYSRCRIYATDLSSLSIKHAKQGRFEASNLARSESNYIGICDSHRLKDYLNIKGDRVSVRPSLKKNMLFFEHNLATDGSFNEFQLIVCRNILVNFNQVLRERVDRLIYDSLSRFGVLALGGLDSVRLLAHGPCYSILDEDSNFYQKDDREWRLTSA